MTDLDAIWWEVLRRRAEAGELALGIARSGRRVLGAGAEVA